MNRTVKKLMKKFKKKNKIKFKLKKPLTSFNSFLGKNKFSMLEVILLLFVTLFVGVMIGYFSTFKLRSEVKNTNDSTFSKVYNSILNNYYKEVSEEELESAAINGIVDYLNDENTYELSGDYYNDLKDQLNGYFCGIGVQVIYENGKLEIVKVIEDSPAERVGLKNNDSIIEVDGIMVDDSNYINLIKGECNKSVNVKVLRKDKEKSFDIVREPISIGNISSQYFDIGDKVIGYIDVDVFSLDSYEMFLNHLNRLENKDIKSLIIDLRSNPGGKVSSTKKIMSLFFEKNTTLYTYNSRNKKTIIKDSTRDHRDYPIVILMDECTASSSEIFISAFKENYGDVTLVGKTTFGKNTIQTNLSLDDDYGIKYTVSEWLTSKGASVKDNGIIPDVDVEAGGINYNDDTQLQEAINILKKKSS